MKKVSKTIDLVVFGNRVNKDDRFVQIIGWVDESQQSLTLRPSQALELAGNLKEAAIYAEDRNRAIEQIEIRMEDES